MDTMHTQTSISHAVCEQRRDRLAAELKSLSEIEMRELGVWCDNIDAIVEQLVDQMGCCTPT